MNKKRRRVWYVTVHCTVTVTCTVTCIVRYHHSLRWTDCTEPCLCGHDAVQDCKAATKKHSRRECEPACKHIKVGSAVLTSLGCRVAARVAGLFGQKHRTEYWRLWHETAPAKGARPRLSTARVAASALRPECLGTWPG